MFEIKIPWSTAWGFYTGKRIITSKGHFLVVGDTVHDQNAEQCFHNIYIPIPRMSML
ncbi:hypothetical protein FHS14_006274 [Paenibacillus baekrokdamisoli]|nr:hypothetical protein [Paenibacillus baekrokdamisoli]